MTRNAANLLEQDQRISVAKRRSRSATKATAPCRQGSLDASVFARTPRKSNPSASFLCFLVRYGQYGNRGNEHELPSIH